jgi:hypothetical protein
MKNDYRSDDMSKKPKNDMSKKPEIRDKELDNENYSLDEIGYGSHLL